MSDGRTWGTIVGAIAGYFIPGASVAVGTLVGGAVGTPLFISATETDDEEKIDVNDERLA